MVSSQKNKLLDCTAHPEHRHSPQEQMAHGRCAQLLRETKTQQREKQEDIDKPCIQDLHDSTVRKAQLKQFGFPAEESPEPEVKYRKSEAVYSANYNYRSHFALNKALPALLCIAARRGMVNLTISCK
ncbi:hypothetical protein [Pedobacter yulinensis]|uniref:hypothetical protein n=1 Tax=Pedobacter yulinensis TaxID=2126353 RepID=UPI0013A610B8|nr:hypothetical protein [Pedobacter yulinensis]